MPKGPNGEKRPADVAQNAFKVFQVAIGEIEEPIEAASHTRKGGKKGGVARAIALTPEQRSEIARSAAAARWKKT